MGMIETLSFLEIVSAGTAELMAGTELLRKFADQNLTLVDAVGLYLMKRHRSKRCWATGRHSGLTGVRLAIDEH